MYRTLPRGRRRGIVIAIAASLPVFVLAACGGGGGGGGTSGSGSPSSFSYLTNTENTTIKSVLTTLSTSSCSAPNKALPLSVSSI